MSKNKELKGVLPVFQTPFHDDESIDAETLKKEIQFAYDRGASGIVMAMASETMRLSAEERKELAGLAVQYGGNRGSVIISVGAESAANAEDFARHAEEIGADAVMAIPPVSTACSGDEIIAYYRRIIEAVSIPLLIQDASAFVGNPIPVESQAALLKEYGEERVQYKPEGMPIGPLISALRDATGGKARMFEGSGGLFLMDNYRRGVVGTMPGVDIVDVMVAFWGALESGDEEKAYLISDRVTSLICMLHNLDAFIVVEKYILKKRGIFKNTIVRGPVAFNLDKETHAEIDRRFDRIMELVT